MTFPYPVFPESMAFGFSSTFDYGNGALMVLNSGAVVSGPVRTASQRNFDFSYNIRDHIDVEAIADIMHDLRVGAFPVLIRDWADYQVTTRMAFGTGDGLSTKMPLYRFYGTIRPVARKIRYPDPTDLVIYENGTPKAIATSDADGVVPVTPWTPYATLEWTGSFYVPVRLTVAGAITVPGPGGKYAEVPKLNAIEDLAA